MKINLTQKETKNRRQKIEEQYTRFSYPIFNGRKRRNLFVEKVREIVISYLNQKLFWVLLVALFLCFSVNFIPSAVAVPTYVAREVEASIQSDRLPPKVEKAVVADLAKLQKIPPGKLKVIKYSQESWSDGCLGLAQPEEICSQAIVEGWRVVVSDGSQEWVYRTDSSGRNVRLESPKVSTHL